MVKYTRRLAALGAFFVAVALIAGCGSSVPGNSVADVDGNPISTQAFNHWMFVAAKSQASQDPTAPVIVPSDPPNFDRCVAQVRQQIPSLAKTSTKQVRADCKQLFTSLSSQVMDFLIKGYWYQAEAARDHIKVTNAQVQKALDTAKAQQFPTASSFNTFLSQTGQTMADLLFRFRINQLYTKLIARYTPKITAATIANYYQSHVSQFGTPESRNMRIVLTTTLAQANAAKKALQSGQSWNVVAKKYSTDATSKNHGGLLVGVTQGEEDAALNKASFEAPVNALVGPVHGQFGYYVFEVTKITPATQKTLAQSTTAIRQTLTSQQQTSAANDVNSAAKKHWFTGTSCRSVYEMADCSGYKAPKTSTTTTPSTATTG